MGSFRVVTGRMIAQFRALCPAFRSPFPRRHKRTQGTGHFTVRPCGPHYRAHPLRFCGFRENRRRRRGRTYRTYRTNRTNRTAADAALYNGFACRALAARSVLRGRGRFGASRLHALFSVLQSRGVSAPRFYRRRRGRRGRRGCSRAAGSVGRRGGGGLRRGCGR